MELQLQKTWDTQQIKQLKSDTGQALLDDESTLVSFSQDFGKFGASISLISNPYLSEQSSDSDSKIAIAFSLYRSQAAYTEALYEKGFQNCE